MSDGIYDTLAARVQRAIDDAFDSIANPNRPSGLRRSKRRKVSTETTIGGGFLVDDDPGSGFLPNDSYEEPPSPVGESEHIRLDLIPSALQRLDLPPDDEEVLAVFKNAASGWSSPSIEPVALPDSGGIYISREDWRAVCAVLLENRPVEDGQIEADDFDSGSDEYLEIGEDCHNEDEDSLSSFDGEDHGDSDDDYGVRRPRRQRSTRGTGSGTLSLDEIKCQSNTLTKRQRQSCLDTLALFFPDVPTAQLESQRIMIKDIQRMAKLLNEKLKADEIVEMLEVFSSSADKSMNFEDFSCMMIAAKLA